MARQRGLGPQGRTAVTRAKLSWNDIKTGRSTTVAVNTAAPEHVNPAVTSHHEPDEQEVAAELDWYDFDSSRVNQAAYDADGKRLFVNFVRPTPGQDEYVYLGVEANEWRNFKRSASPGKYVNRVLNGHNYHRVN